MFNYTEIFKALSRADYTWDIEATGLLDETAIDYTASPYRLKAAYGIHCVVFENIQTKEIIAFYDGEKIIFDGRPYDQVYLPRADAYTSLLDYAPVEYTHYPMAALKAFIQYAPKRRVVAHNQISYDLMAMKLKYGIDFTIGDEVRSGGLTTFTSDTWGGNNVAFWDTLVVSKCLNPDRYGGHSLDNLSKGLEVEKYQFRKDIHIDSRFLDFAPDMLYYNILDVQSNTLVYKKLIADNELNDSVELTKWASALKLEHNVAEIITRQEHRGFAFDMDLAREALDELDAMMEERRTRVEPLLPPRPATKAFMSEYTPPARQIKKNGELTSYMIKFLEKHEGTYDADKYEATIFGKTYSVPMECEPLKTTMPATIDDTTHIKEWLVSEEIGWNPQEYKEKDLTVDSKKNKLSDEAIAASVERYVKQTFASSFKRDRLAHFELGERISQGKFQEILMKRAKRSLKVLSNPSFTVGADKDMDPDLNRIAEKFPFAKDVIEYLTFRHRRNSILGGGVDWDDPDEEPEKGYIANVREDGRIATPADTCGAATSRFKHRKVANIPRVTSLYGEKLRALFGVVGADSYQIGYDFDSLEARVESAYCWMYEFSEEKDYCESLMKDKPFDVHTMMAKRISEIIQSDFGRSPAKNVKYGCTYGAQAAKVAKTIGSTLEVGQMVFDAFWEAALPLKLLKEALTRQWEENGKKYIYGIDGRRVPTRSAHAILNSLFQSGGVICAKRAMVIHDRKLKAEGLAVDFFMEDWKAKGEWCQQMIAYHDEAQLEVTRKSVSFKMFPNKLADHIEDKKEKEKYLKELCQVHKDNMLAETGQIWSDISHYDKAGGGYFVAYSRAGELTSLAVKEAGEFYRLTKEQADELPSGHYALAVRPESLDLTAGYILGTNWSTCH